MPPGYTILWLLPYFQEVTKEVVTTQELGGAVVHTKKSGVCITSQLVLTLIIVWLAYAWLTHQSWAASLSGCLRMHGCWPATLNTK